ncbi:biotin transporter BioY [Paenibacillaceae bacterium]|nr:biotin transporter BioY [Paenibacillaceae bacterium]
MSSPIRRMVFTALFAALFIVLSAIKIPLGFTPIPISLQNLGAMLSAAFLGPIYGFLSILAVVLLTALGLPLLHGEGGLALLLGPTGGFIWSFSICALVTGFVVQRALRSSLLKQRPALLFIVLVVSFMLFGPMISYLCGVPWLAYSYQMSLGKAIAAGMTPFLPGDIIKSLVSAGVVMALRPYLPAVRISK